MKRSSTRPSRGRSSAAATSRSGVHRRQRDDERRALAEPLALGAYRAAVQLHELLDDREPQPEPAPRSVTGLVLLHARIEDALAHLGGAADAFVRDEHLDAAAVLPALEQDP